MDRRESLKALMASTVATGFVMTSCLPEAKKEETASTEDSAASGYGRTPEELERDKELFAKTFFNEHEMATIAILANIIIPADEKSGSATDAGVPDFIEFIVKDMPGHQTPLRGGLMWLDHECNKRFGKVFKDATSEEQLAIVDDIAYPDEVKPGLEQGVQFFNRMRNLVATGFYTSKIGIEDIGYMGNVPNVWDGVPEDELNKHGFSYNDKWKDLYIKPEERNEVADWSKYGEL